MTPKANNVTRLTTLVTPADYQTANPHLFPSVNALAWFIRRHAALLVKRRALLKVNGRKVIDPDRFDAAVVEAGHADMLTDQRGGARRRVA
jgi:hypothetical protein